MKRDTQTLKKALITTALKDIEENGIDNLSIRQVAKRCGITHGAPYRHFGSKEGYLKVLVEEISASFSQIMMSGVTDAETSQEKLLVMGQNVLRYAQQSPHFFDVLFIKFPTTYLTFAEEHIIAHESFPGFTRFVAIVQTLKQEASLKASEKEIALHLWSYILGLAMIVRSEVNSKLSQDAISDNLSEFLSIYITGGQA